MFKQLIVIVGLFFSCQAYALSFGDLKLYSYLNEPLSAEIELIDLGNVDAGALRVNLASDKDFTLAGISKAFGLNKLKFKIITVKTKSVIYIWTQDSVKEPFLEFLIELEWPNGKMIKDFTILLDPPDSHAKDKNTPLALTKAFQSLEENKANDSELQANFPYDAKLAEKLKNTAPDVIPAPVINADLTTKGNSLKEIANGFAVAENEILQPAMLPEKKFVEQLPIPIVINKLEILKELRLVIPSWPPVQVPLLLPGQQVARVALEKAKPIIVNKMPPPMTEVKPIVKMVPVKENETSVILVLWQKYSVQILIAVLLSVTALMLLVKIIRRSPRDTIVEPESASGFIHEEEEPFLAEAASIETVENTKIEEIKIPDLPQINTPLPTPAAAEIAVRLNLAKSYIAADDQDSAKEILLELLKSVAGEDKIKVEQLLNSLK